MILGLAALRGMGPFGFKVTTSCVPVIGIYFLELNGFRVASGKVTREKEIRKKKKETSFYHLACIHGYLLGAGEGIFCELPSCRAGGRV